MIDKTLTAAITAHEVNREYCLGLGDDSQPVWDQAPDWQKESALAGVKAIAEDPTQGPETSHEGWMAQKLSDGWKQGPVKDAEKKEHPCIVPYAELSPSQRAKDTIFGAVVRGVLGV
jgi:hypothetical protein